MQRYSMYSKLYVSIQFQPSENVPGLWPRLDMFTCSYSRKGVFHTKFSITAPQFLISPEKIKLLFVLGLFLMPCLILRGLILLHNIM